MAPLNPKALEYTPICAAAYTPCPTSHSYAIHHLCPTSTISSHHYHLLPFANFFPPVTPYYYTQLHLAPPPLPAVPPPCTPPPVTAPSTSVTHKHFDAGPSRPSPSWTTGVIGFDHRRNSESVTRPGCQMFRKRLGKHQVIHLRCFPKKTSVMIKNIPYNYTYSLYIFSPFCITYLIKYSYYIYFIPCSNILLFFFPLLFGVNIFSWLFFFFWMKSSTSIVSSIA